MRQLRLLPAVLALSLLIGCGDKQPPATTSPGGGLDSGGITPITPVEPPSSDPSDFNPPGDDFEPPLEEPGEEPLEEPLEEPGEEPSEEPSEEPEPEPTPEPEPVIAAPTAVVSSSIGLTGFTLGWTGPDNAIAYQIYLNNELKLSNVNGKTMALTGLEQGTEYSVEITALTEAGEESARSTALTVTTRLIAMPADLAESELDHDSVKLSWTAAEGASTYNLYLNGSKTQEGLTGTSYTLTGLTPETSYTVELSAVTSEGESAKTEALSLSTPKAPDPFGNERIGFLDMSALESGDGLDVKNGHAFVGHFVAGGIFSTHKRYVRDMNMSNGSTNNIEISTQGTTKVIGVATNAAVIWAGIDQFDKDGWNLYKFNISGQRLLRYKIGEDGTILSDIAVDSATGLVYAASRTHKRVVKFNEVTSDAIYDFSGLTNIDPLGLAVDSAGNVYTYDGISKKLIKFAGSDGSRLLEFGPTGLNNTGEIFTAVKDVAVDPRNGDIYITGNASNGARISRFNKDGNFLRSFKDGDLSDPLKLTVDADGKIYVLDASKKGVLVFTPGITP